MNPGPVDAVGAAGRLISVNVSVIDTFTDSAPPSTGPATSATPAVSVAMTAPASPPPPAEPSVSGNNSHWKSEPFLPGSTRQAYTPPPAARSNDPTTSAVPPPSTVNDTSSNEPGETSGETRYSTNPEPSDADGAAGMLISASVDV